MFYLYSSDKSRSSRRTKAAEARDGADTSRCVTSDPSPGASKCTRLKERLALSGCSQPPGLKPRPPSMPRVRDQLSPPSRTLSPGSYTAYRNDSNSRERTPAKKRDVAVTAGRTNAPLSSQKHQNQKERASKAAPAKDEADGSGSSWDRRKAQCVVTNVHRKTESVMRNEAARIIQRAWRRWVMRACVRTCRGS